MSFKLGMTDVIYYGYTWGVDFWSEFQASYAWALLSSEWHTNAYLIHTDANT